MAYDVERLRREEFPQMAAGGEIYMNAASTGPSPARSVAAQVDFVNRRAMPHRVGFDDQFGTLARCRELVARLINADESEIALATNTGIGINIVAWGLPLGRGDTVVVPDAEFPANMYPWLGAAEARGFNVHVVPLTNGLLDEEALLDAVDTPGVRVLSVSWCGFSNGVVANLQKLGEACRARGVFFVVDGIQGLGPMTIDVKHTPVDVFACGAQKWLLGPWGSGFTYVRREIMEALTPQPVSWMAVRGSDDFRQLVAYDLTWRDEARRFEMVTLPYQDFAGMAASLELIHELGPAHVSSHAMRCARALLDGACERRVECVTPLPRHGGIAAVRPTDAPAVSARLDAAGVIHSLREGTIRLAPYLYTTDEDVERTLELLSS
jgi:cysteine desulfurase/selenocysteine lyase